MAEQRARHKESKCHATDIALTPATASADDAGGANATVSGILVRVEIDTRLTGMTSEK